MSIITISTAFVRVLSTILLSILFDTYNDLSAAYENIAYNVNVFDLVLTNVIKLSQHMSRNSKVKWVAAGHFFLVKKGTKMIMALIKL